MRFAFLFLQASTVCTEELIPAIIPLDSSTTTNNTRFYFMFLARLTKEEVTIYIPGSFIVC